MEDTRGWKLGQRETDEGLSLIRLKDIEPTFAFDEVPERMTVVWSFRDPESHGLPSEAESEAMKNFEDHICKGIETDNRAILCIVFTEPGYREWHFYSRNVEGFLEAINLIPQGSEPFPIEIHHDSDSDGAFYKSYAEGMSGP